MAHGKIGKIASGLTKGAIGVGLIGTGVGHLTFLRDEFQAQVPNWFAVDVDTVVLVSGAAEIALGAANLAVWKQPARAWIGGTTAAFFIIIFPGNIAQFVEAKDGFGLDTDQKRFARLFFQPLLVAGALAGGKTVKTLRDHRRK